MSYGILFSIYKFPNYDYAAIIVRLEYIYILFFYIFYNKLLIKLRKTIPAQFLDMRYLIYFNAQNNLNNLLLICHKLFCIKLQIFCIKFLHFCFKFLH